MNYSKFIKIILNTILFILLNYIIEKIIKHFEKIKYKKYLYKILSIKIYKNIIISLEFIRYSIYKYI